MRLGFYFDQSRCIGCHTCVISCKDWSDLKDNSVNWIKITEIEAGKYPKLSVKYLFNTCFHCEKPACVKACPAGAITKRDEDGIVVVNRQLCPGSEKCNFVCQRACPYNAPQIGDGVNPKMQKCNFCLDRWKASKKPICVDACPMRALDAGPIEELRNKYGREGSREDMPGSGKVEPSIIYRYKKAAARVGP